MPCGAMSLGGVWSSERNIVPSWHKGLSVRVTPFSPTLRGTWFFRAQPQSPITLPSGGSVIFIALLLPVFMMLLMLALEAFEDFLFRPAKPRRSPPGHGERSAPKRIVERG